MSVAFRVIGRLPSSRFVPYVVVQLAGATVAAAACRALFLPDAVMQTQLGIPLPAAWVSRSGVLLAEFIMTFLLMTAIIGTAVDERGKALKIGAGAGKLAHALGVLGGARPTYVT